jgi:hypothetical protein
MEENVQQPLREVLLDQVVDVQQDRRLVEQHAGVRIDP